MCPAIGIQLSNAKVDQLGASMAKLSEDIAEAESLTCTAVCNGVPSCSTECRTSITSTLAQTCGTALVQHSVDAEEHIVNTDEPFDLRPLLDSLEDLQQSPDERLKLAMARGASTRTISTPVWSLSHSTATLAMTAGSSMLVAVRDVACLRGINAHLEQRLELFDLTTQPGESNQPTCYVCGESG